MMDNQLLYQEDKRGVVSITLNRPEKQNAFTPEMIDSFLKYLDDLSESKTARILLIQSQGDHFCSGADLDWMKSSLQLSKEENTKDAKRLADLYFKLYNLNMPTLALVRGNVYGGGLGIVACCDLVIADDISSSFCFSEVKLGLAPATIAPYVISAIGERAALRYFLTAQQFDAKTALKIGLISEIDHFLNFPAHSQKIVEVLLANSQTAMQQTKRLVRSISTIDECFYEDTVDLIAILRQSPEAQSRLARFLKS